MSQIISQDLVLKDVRKKYMDLMQYAIKKGNKNKMENIFRNLLFFMIKTPTIDSNFQFKSIATAFANTTPKISIKTKRKGSKNIYIPIAISSSRSQYLSSN
jgi:ribosomal protein S7